MSDQAEPAQELPKGKSAVIHPWWVRLTHWINALAILIMAASGWQIYNASPIFDIRIDGAIFKFPIEITLGRWLAGAIMWHFAAMWLLVANGFFYVTMGIVTGRFRRKLLPITPGALFRDIKAALTFKLSHADLSVYNAIQKLLYSGVILLGVIIVLSGLAIWKPVQLQELTALFGGFEFARIVHFAAMAAIVLFVIVHVAVALLVPKSIKAMILGR